LATPTGSPVHDQSYRWLGYFLPWATVVVLLAAYFYHGETRHELARLETLDAAATRLGADTLTRCCARRRGRADPRRRFRSARVARSAGRRPARQPGRGLSEHRAHRRTMTSFAGSTNRTGKSARQCGAGGRRAVPAAQLQKKADRYYFAATMALKPGGLYLSPLDLNIENGRIEVPIKPMIRIATPVSDSRGQSRASSSSITSPRSCCRLRSVTGGSGRGPCCSTAKGLAGEPEARRGMGFHVQAYRHLRRPYPAAWAAVRRPTAAISSTSKACGPSPRSCRLSMSAASSRRTSRRGKW